MDIVAKRISLLRRVAWDYGKELENKECECFEIWSKNYDGLI